MHNNVVAASFTLLYRPPMKISFCSKCNAEIVWLETNNGKRISLDLPPVKRFALSRNGLVAYFVDTFTTHYDTCPRK